MPDKGWKKFERRLAYDLGVRRIPVTGFARHSADLEDTMFCYQAKLRKVIPRFLFDWLSGICGTAATSGRIGVLVLKTPRMDDRDAVVCVKWADWVSLHGPIRFDEQPHRLAERAHGKLRRAQRKADAAAV